jgi:hypothetical protein
MERNLS